MRYIFILFAAAQCAVPLPSGELDATLVSHVVVIPDAHGDLQSLLFSLFLAQAKVDPSRSEESFTDFKRRFNDESAAEAAPTRVAIVQLGDLMDRGPDSAECVEAMSRGERVLGWRTVQLYGNHELMTMLAPQAEYVHKQDFRGWR